MYGMVQKKLDNMIINRPQLHFTAKNGWINDPNGCIYFKNKFHIFFQHNSHSNEQVNICWGHAISDDLIHFEEVGDALLNDKQYDKIGCWSGGAVVINDRLYLLYTSFGYGEDGRTQQTISLAYSDDGIHFEKYENNPVIRNEDKPHGCSIEDFRDPFIYCGNNMYYVMIGTKNENQNEAMILLYRSEDLIHYQFVKVLTRSDKHGTMFECPSIGTYNNYDLLIFSPQNKKKIGYDFDNISSSVYQINKHKQPFVLNRVKEIDHGCDFYAPLLFKDDKNLYMIAWNYMWGRNYLHQNFDLPWCGNLTLPRIIKLKNYQLRQYPISLDNYLRKINSVEVLKDEKVIAISNQKVFEIKIKFNSLSDSKIYISLNGNDEDKVEIIFDYRNETVIFDKSNLKNKLGGLEDNSTSQGIRKCKLVKCKNDMIDLIFDEHITELFFNDYRDSMTNLTFIDLKEVTIKSNTKLNLEIRSK